MSNKSDGADPSGTGGLGELFAEVTREVPPPSFDLDDVTVTSARITARRRRAAVGASTLGVVVLAVGLVTAVSFFGHTGNDQTSIAAKDRASATTTVHKAKPFGVQETQTHQATPLETQNDPDASPKQGGEATGESGPRAGAPRPGCAEADRELADALAGELPAAPSTDPMPVGGPCPDGTRAVSFRITGTDHHGRISALLVPAGAPDLPDLPGVDSAVARTTHGDSLVVRSEPDSPLDAPPISTSGVHDIAEHVADDF